MPIYGPHQRIRRRLCLLLTLAIVCFIPELASAEDWTCGSCNQTYQFDSRDGGFRSSFIGRHQAVCKSSDSPSPTIDPGPVRDLGEERRKQEEADRKKRFVRACEVWVDLRAAINEETELNHDLYLAQREYLSTMEDAMEAAQRGMLLQAELESAQVHLDQWQKMGSKAAKRRDGLRALADGSQASLIEQLNDLNERGLFTPDPEPETPDTSFLPEEKLPEEDRFARWNEEASKAPPLKVDVASPPKPTLPSLQAIPPQPRSGTKEELTALESSRDRFRAAIESTTARIRDVRETTQAKRSETQEQDAENQRSRTRLDKVRLDVEYAKAEFESAVSGTLIETARHNASIYLKDRILELLPEKTRGSLTELSDEAQDVLSGAAPLLRSFGLIKEYGEIMHRQVDEGGAIERIFKAIMASVTLHLDPEGAERARLEMNMAIRTWGTGLQDLGTDSELFKLMTSPLFKDDDE